MAGTGEYDVVVIGAGAAGLGAAARLAEAGLSVVTVEAKDRVGGRAHSLHGRSGAGIDLGCGWLHSADQNEWAKMAEPMGFTLDRSPAAWTKPALGDTFPPEAQRAYRAAFERFEALLEAEAEEPADRPASDFFDQVDPRWVPLLNAFSGYYNGAPFDRISVKDYAAYQPTEENWRVREGYGALVTAFAQPLDLRLSMPVKTVEHGGPGVRAILADGGVVAARAAVLAVSTTVLAEERLRFDPPLPDKVEAAADLPLGNVEKAFLRLAEPDAFPVESRVYARIDTADTPGYSLRPMGLPVIECFFGGELAAELEAEADGALAAFAIDELVGVFGSHFRRRVEPLAASAWRSDPFIRGAYSHARVGRSEARLALAAPVGERLFFAGEATSPHAFSTAHGAYESGVRAAEEALGFLRPS